ncbi:MAG TPA: MlaD family protein [Micropepsaceae bacterium]|nr:MlaD family protein [Micropepsaceae bacterium]
METRAHHVLVGGFALVITLALFGFLTWLGQFEFDRRYSVYQVNFVGGVSGLAVGAEVTYNGIKVGEVTQVALNQTDPNVVEVLLQVDAGTPIKTGTRATVEVGILTGVGTLILQGGSASQNAIEAAEGQDYPVIEVGDSAFDTYVNNAFTELNKVGNFFAEATKLLTEENLASITNALNGIESGVDDLRLIVSENREAISRIINRIDSITANADRVIANLAEASGRFDTIMQRVEQIVINADRAVAEIADESVPQATLFMQDARDFLVSMDRLIDRIESDPSGFIFGNDAATYEQSQ